MLCYDRARMDTSVAKVVAALESTAETTVIWQKGLLNPGGPHRRLKGSASPISIGEDECATFGKLIRELRPEHCFIIGNAFGFSAAYIADVMKEHGGKRVVTLDSQSEGPGQRCAKLARELTDKLALNDILINKKGWSPQDIPGAVEVDTYPFIFIDGNHFPPHATRDFEGMLPYSNDQTVFVWHDSWIQGVVASVERAKQLGFRCLWVPTSCEMILGTKDDAMFARLQRLFPEGVENKKPRSALDQYVIGVRETLSFWFGLLRGR